MELFVDQFLNGIGRGAVYASVGLALVLIYRTTGLLNFAQGEMALFSTFVTWWFTDQGLGIVPAILLSAVLSFIGGAVIERVLIRPVESTNKPLNVVIVTLGLFLAFNALSQLVFIKPGREALRMPSPFPSGEIAGISKETIGLVLVLALECLLLWMLLQRTKLGLALRATASNPESARLVGVNTGNMLMVGWGLAAGLGAIAGSLVASQSTGFDTSLMQQILVYSFAGAALGGFDSPIGAVIGGLILGVVESLTFQYGHHIGLDGIELVVPMGLILAVLLVKPNGLFGRTIVERV